MSEVIEIFESYPFDGTARTLRRDERTLLSPAISPVPMLKWDDIPPLSVCWFDQEYHHAAFAPPRVLFEGETGRIEWQQMTGRQPMYHRNLDVDELAFQICGERTLITELGTAEQRPGDFVRIPVGVAHDNYGREDTHILWYFPTPIEDVGPVTGRSERLIPPFEGWEAAEVNEVHTDCLGGLHCDRAVQRSDELLLLEQFDAERDRLAVMRAQPGANETIEIWRGPDHWIGLVDVTDSDGRRYLRRRNVDEIQYQVSGTRLLISANGVVEMKPGTFVHLPVGVAYASIVAGRSTHISTLTTSRIHPVWSEAFDSERWSLEQIEEYRRSVQDNGS